MKTLLFVRHAKSSWESPDMADIERTLNKRGMRDAPFMADLMQKKDIEPDLLLSSPAVRAFTTAKFFADAFGIDHKNIVRKNLIYDRGPRQILYMINELDDNYSCIMVFGHNPDLTSLSNFLSEQGIQSMPTCGVVCIDFDTDSWASVGDDPGTLRFYEHPKMYLPKT